MSNRAQKIRIGDQSAIANRLDTNKGAASTFASIASLHVSSLPHSKRYALAGLGRGFVEAAENVRALAANDDQRAAFWASPTTARNKNGTLASATLHLLLGIGLFIASQQFHLVTPPEDAIELVMVSAPPVETPPQVAKAEVTPSPPPVAPTEEAVAPVKPPKVLRKATPKPEKKVLAPSPAVSQMQPSAPAATTPPPPKAIPTDYAAKIFERVSNAAANSYPRAAMLKSQEGSVSYHVTLASDGTLKDFSVEPSGNSSFDKAAGEAIQKSSPFPTPPDLGASSYKLSGIITYRLTE